jgi:streptomycin 6-kinase
MAAANRELPLPPPTPHAAVSTLSSFHRALFDEAARALGEAEYVKATDHADSDFDQADWIKLHHSFDS